MPTYEYVCGACGHEFERRQKISDNPLRKCPACGRQKARRRISAGGGVVFKGPGFYATDYRKPPPGESKSSTGAGSSSDRGGESKGKEGESKGKARGPDSRRGEGSGD